MINNNKARISTSFFLVLMLVLGSFILVLAEGNGQKGDQSVSGFSIEPVKVVKQNFSIGLPGESGVVSGPGGPDLGIVPDTSSPSGNYVLPVEIPREEGVPATTPATTPEIPDDTEDPITNPEAVIPATTPEAPGADPESANPDSVEEPTFSIPENALITEPKDTEPQIIKPILPKVIEPVVIEPIITEQKMTLMALIIDKLKAFIGEIVKITAILTYENDTPIEGEIIDFYQEELIGSAITDAFGQAIILWNTSGLSEGTYGITASYGGTADHVSSSNSFIVGLYGQDNSEGINESTNESINQSINTNLSDNLLTITIPNNFTLQDSKRKNVQASYKISAKKEKTGFGIVDAGERYDVEIVPEKGPVKKIFLEQVNLAKVTNLGFEELPKDYPSPIGGWSQVFAIDPTAMDFTEGLVTYTAAGPELYKCKDYDFADQNCFGEWVLVAANLIPGEDYTFILTAEDPIFANSVSTCSAEDQAATPGTWGSACDATDGSLIETDNNLVETHSSHKNGGTTTSGGIRIQSVDSTITTCSAITRVELCYEWWASEIPSGSCRIAVDASGGSSYSTVTTTCPGTTPNPGVTCTNVGALETWVCGNFFGASGTRGLAFAEHQRSGGANSVTTFSWDVFFFNVTYTSAETVVPLVTWTAPTNGSNYTKLALNKTFSASIYESFVDSVLFSFDNASGTNFNVTAVNQSGIWTASYNVSMLAEGTNIITVIANDTSNNRNNTVQITIFTDYSAPRVTWTAPANNSNYSIRSSNQTFSSRILEENYAEKVLFSFDNSSGTNFNVTGTNSSGTWSASYNVSYLAEGLNIITILANDTAGNFNTSRYLAITVDNTAPIVTITAPANQSNFTITTYNKTFSATIRDLTIQTVLFSFDNASGNNFNVTAVNASGTWSASYNVSLLPEGVHTTTVLANDSVANFNTTQYISFTIDNTVPNVTWTAPANNSNYSIRTSNITFSSTITDVTMQSALFSFDNASGTAFNATATNSSGTWSLSYNVSQLAEGTHTITVMANDSVGYWNTTQYRSFIVDFTVPNVTINLPAGGNLYSITSYNQTFNATVIDANFVQNVIFSFGNASGANFNVTAVNNSGYWIAYYNVSSLAEGVQVVTVIANDSAGNFNNTQTVSFTVDNSPPNVTDPLPYNTSISGDRFFNISNDIEVGANATDLTYVSQVFANISYPNGSAILYELSNSTGHPSKFNMSFTIPNVTGNYNITFLANDTSNNRNYTTSTNFTVNDTGLPNVTILLPLAGSNFNEFSNISIEVNATDGLSISGVNATITAPNSSIFNFNLSNGNQDTVWDMTFNHTETTGVYTLLISANDTSNNINNTQSRTFNVQSTTPPLVTLVSPSDGGTLVASSVTFTCNATDSGGMHNISLYHNISGTFVWNQTKSMNGTSNETTFNINPVADAKEYGWNCRAFDGDGNDAYALNNFTFSMDTTPPNVTNVSPSRNSRFNISSTISINASVVDSFSVGIVYANISYPNGSAFLLTLNDENSDNVYNNSYLIPNAIGLYNVTIIANDSNNNKNVTEFTNFTATDGVTATVTWISPGNETNYSLTSGNQTFNVSVAEILIDTVLFGFSNSSGTDFNVTAVNQSGYWTASYNLSKLSEGVQTVTVFANDTSGNINITEVRTITIDFTAPNVTNVTPSITVTILNHLLGINATIFDTLSVDSAFANVSFPNGSFHSIRMLDDNADNIFNASLNATSLGVYNFTIITNDTLNHVNNTQGGRFNVTIIPNITLIAPANTTTFTYSFIDFNYSVINDGNLSNCTLYGNFTGSWGADKTATTIQNSSAGSSSLVNISNFIPDGNHVWNIQCTDVYGNSNFSLANRTISVSTELTGLFSYQEQNMQKPLYRTWNKYNISGNELNSTFLVDGDITWVVTKAGHERKEFIIGTEDKNNNVKFQVYDVDRDAWTNFSSNTDGANAGFRAFDIAYEEVSGDALIVYESASGSNQVISYRTWNGTEFSSAQTYTTNLTAAPISWVSLTADKDSDNIMLLIHNNVGELYAVPWNGTNLDITRNTTLSTATVSSSEQHFDFAWEESSGEGLVLYGESTNLVYRTYNSTAWGEESTMALGDSLDTARFCSEENSDYIGLIFQTNLATVNVSMWNGSQFLAGAPTADSATELHGTNNVNVDCVWLNQTTALFGFIDADSLSMDYFTFVRDSWNASALTSTATTINFASDDIGGLRFVKHPVTQEVMVTAVDIAEDISSLWWDNSNFQSISSSPFEQNTEVVDAAQEGVMFDWLRYDQLPNVTGLNLNISTINSGDTINVSVNITDDFSVGVVVANITLAGSSVEKITLTDDDNDGMYNGTITETSSAGSYTVTIFAVDNSTHGHSNSSTTTTFLVLDTDAALITWVTPINASNFTISSSNQTFNVSNLDTSPDTVYFSFDNSSGNDFNVSAINQSGYWTTSYNVSKLAEGTHLVKIFANDTSGNVNYTEQITIIVDFSAPSVNFTSPANQSNFTITSSNQTFNVTVLETNYVDTVLFSFDNASGTNFNVTAVNQTGYWSASYNVSTLAEGLHRVSVLANDSAGNFNTTRYITLTIDNTAPIVTWTAPTNNSNYTIASSNQTFSSTINDLTIQTVLFSFDNSSGTNFNVTAVNQSGTWSISYNVSELAEGIHTVTILANDSVGNFNTTQYVTFTVDSTAPLVTWITPVNSSNYTFSSSNQTFNATIHNLLVQAVLFSFDNASGTNFNATAINQSGHWIASYNVSELAEGINVITVIANDTVGSWNNSQQITITVDKTVPAVTWVAPTDLSKYDLSSSNQTFNASVAELNHIYSSRFNFDNASGTGFNVTAINQTGYWTASYNVSKLAEGVHVILVHTNDSAGNTNNTESITLIVDFTPPNVTELLPLNQSSRGAFNISETFEISVNISDVTFISDVFANVSYPNGSTILYTLSNSTGNPQRFNTSWTAPAQIGNYNITFVANDTLNNYNNTETTNYSVNDVVVPNVTFNNPPADSNVLTTSTVLINVTVQDQINVSVVVANITAPNGSVFERTLIDDQADGTFNFTFTDTETAGTYNISIFANDTSNNINKTTSRTFNTQELDAPLVNLLFPVTGNFNNTNTIIFSCNATENTELANLTLYHNISGQFIANQTSNVNGTGNSTTFTVNTIADGYYGWNCLGEDTSSNRAFAIANFTLTVDSTVPNVTSITPSQNRVFNITNTINISVTMIDSFGLSTTTVNVTLPNGSVTTLTLVDENGDNVFNVTYTIPASLGLYNLTFFAQDNAKNINKSEISNFSVNDVTVPNVTELLPANSSISGRVFNISNVLEMGANATDQIYISQAYANMSYPNGSNILFALTNSTGHPSKYNSSFTIPALIGNYNITFIANDTSNNYNNTQSINFSVNDILVPNVTTILPENSSISGRVYNISNIIEIAANATDQTYVSKVYANISYPNGSSISLALSNSTGYSSKYNSSFTIPALMGNYNITFIANDSSNNYNNTQTTNFSVNDVTPPNVTNLVPSADTSFDFTDDIQIGVNISDQTIISQVFANISFPNGSTILYNLSNGTLYRTKFNFTFGAFTAIGKYNVTFVANDSSNNYNNTQQTNFSITESVAPTVTAVGCTPLTVNLSTRTQCIATITDNLEIGSVTATVTLPNGSNYSQTVTNISSNYLFNFTNTTWAVGRHNVTWFANDSSANNAFATDYFNVTDEGAPNVTLIAPVNDFNTSSTSINFNFTVTDNHFTTLACSIAINGTVNQTNSSVLNGTQTIFSLTGFVEGDHIWNVSCNDSSSNINVSTARNFTVDTSGPYFASLTTSPNTAAGLDPNANITIFANVTDNVTFTQMVVFQYKNSSDSSYTNVTMVYNGFTLLYNTSFNATTEGVYNLRLWANDSVGNSGYSNLLNITTIFDKNWTRVPATFPAKSATLNSIVQVGNLTVNNTGDFSLEFTIVSDSNKTTYNQTENFTLAAGEVIQITISDNASDSGIKTVTLNISSNDTTTVPYSLATTGSLVVAPNQPILLISFTSPDSETISVTQGDTNVEFIAKIENIGEGNATNVNFSLDIPDDWTVTFGQLNATYATLDSGASQQLAIEVTVPGGATTGSFSVIANSTGTNTSGVNLHDADGVDLIFADKIAVTVNAKAASLGTQAAAVVVADTPSGSAAASSAGAGGGSGSAIPGRKAIASEDVFSIFRGKKQTFPITISNVYENSVMNNVQIKLDGFLAKYVSWSPEVLNGLATLETKEFFLTLTVPEYFSEARYELVATITADVFPLNEKEAGYKSKKITEQRRIILHIKQFTEEDLSKQMTLAQRCIAEMDEADFNTELVRKLLDDAKKKIAEYYYDDAKKNLDVICKTKDTAFAAYDLITKLEKQLDDIEKQAVLGKAYAVDVKTPDTLQALELARLAFARGDYNLAFNRLKDAQLNYILETKGTINILRLVVDYWWSILLSILPLLVLFGVLRKRIWLAILRQRIASLNKEEEGITGLIVDVQKDYLRRKVISHDQYERYMGNYRRRLSTIKLHRAKLKSRSMTMLDARAARVDLKKEKKELLSHLKSAQKSYLVTGSIRKGQYAQQADSIQARLGEVHKEEENLRHKIKNEKHRTKFFSFINRISTPKLFSKKYHKQSGRRGKKGTHRAR
jgi:hypothetical protein